MLLTMTHTVEIRTRLAGSDQGFTSWLAVGPLDEVSALELAGEVARAMRHLYPHREFALFHAGERLEK